MNASLSDSSDIRIETEPSDRDAPGRTTRVALAAIRFYQRNVSPALPMIFGPACGCRFSPTCSEYAAGAFSAHGALVGSWLTVRRLTRCHPFQRGGFDPVPAPDAYRAPARPRAVRVTPPAFD